MNDQILFLVAVSIVSCIFGWIKGKRNKKRKLSPMEEFRSGIGNRFYIGGVWGRSIQWFPNYKAQRVCGWFEPKPKKGDWLLCGLVSGKTGLWKFGEIEECGDPKDMFFADVEAIGYIE